MKTEATLKAGDVVSYHEKGYRVGRVVESGKKWIRVEVLGYDPRTTKVKRFQPDQLKLVERGG
jgi:hypothetical protein